VTDFEALISRLAEAGVLYVVVDGFAGTVLGSPRITIDLDIVYGRDSENLQRLCTALEPLDPYLRGAPRGLPFRLDVATLERGLNFTLTTTAGDIDLLGEIAGGGDYARRRLRAAVGERPDPPGVRSGRPGGHADAAHSSEAGGRTPEGSRGDCGARGAGRRAAPGGVVLLSSPR
jgi:hypothetical protein